jgi:transposase
MEAARDLARAREDCRADLMRARHLLSKLLLRKGVVYDGGTTWTRRHREWLSRVELPDPCERLVLGEYLEGVLSLELRRARLDAAIAARAREADLAPVVSALRCLRGISTVTAFSIATEVGDFSRFPSGRKVTSWLGLAPSESSSALSTRLGAITRCGCRLTRTLLVECAWAALRCSPASGKACPASVDARVRERARTLSQRLCEHRRSMLARGVAGCKANAATAAELGRFMYFLGQEQQAMEAAARAA